jgi:translation initiation factor 1
MSDSPFHNPFEVLGSLKARRPAARVPEPATVPADAKRAVRPAVRRAVVRMERSGRGGKEVTVVEQLGLPPAGLQAWLKDLKSALGCGGTVEDGALVLQGDHRQRLPAMLSARGVKRVTTG